MGATFVDTETTGIKDAQPIELAYCGPVEVTVSSLEMPSINVQRFRPTKDITFGAMAAHHILDEDLAREPLWAGLWNPPAGTEYIIGHNIDFDWQALGMPQVKRICTLALARFLWPDLDSHSLGALTYRFSESREEARTLVMNAHSARIDVVLLLRLMTVIAKHLPASFVTWEGVWEASERARVPERMTFGKYGPDSDYGKANGGKGMPCREVRRLDPGYWNWLMDKCDQVRDNVYLQRALRGD